MSHDLITFRLDTPALPSGACPSKILFLCQHNGQRSEAHSSSCMGLSRTWLDRSTSAHSSRRSRVCAGLRASSLGQHSAPDWMTGTRRCARPAALLYLHGTLSALLSADLKDQGDFRVTSLSLQRLLLNPWGRPGSDKQCRGGF